jgi:myosin heavy subunit
VFHFAGVVEYAVAGFVDKSKNKVPSLMEELIVSEKNAKSFVSLLFPELKKKSSSSSAANGARGGGKC